MKTSSSLTLVAFVLAAANAAATTTLTSSNFDLDADATWDNGIPSALGDPDGQINTDYNFDDMGSGNTGGNFDASGLGAISITQTAGNGIGDQYNVHSNPNFTFNLNGGSMTSDGGSFIINGTNFNIGGGSLSALEFRLANGSMNVTSGSFTASLISLRGGTFNQTGGIITSNHGGPVFNRADTTTTLNLLGGSLIAGANNNNSLLQSIGLDTTIGGSLTADLPGALNIFAGGNHGNSSTLNFNSDWTGSLTLDSATAWDNVFEAGDIFYDGTELGANDFESYFQNNNGVITLVPEPSSALLGLIGCGGLLVRRRRHA
ncbi:PEP-CTERM sorting domain-containing protein [Haloferula chungangensis]|uniref:PEP-CTERM sorting domain-containing protein n=1 Tax=Haloferula chungangensis TaxID=1048331 RepID=A0ABW2L8X2_9BACT